ncbi:MAG: cytochrome C [Nitrospinae bacterium CG11_big_fil_rev_8_21_14_0_20_56_8]|nr:MAG: cytochrome C [Nitrospinae bacterium CG11_big_fil_rev_8_21_14_0_20_56_8]
MTGDRLRPVKNFGIAGLGGMLILLLVTSAGAVECPQPRSTSSAPADVLNLKNPLADNGDAVKAGEKLYRTKAKPIACQFCHGSQGDGNGDPSFKSKPPARIFTCAPTMSGLSDGQLFWIIQNGSPNTSMPAFKALKDQEVWQLISYIRGFAK